MYLLCLFGMPQGMHPKHPNFRRDLEFGAWWVELEAFYQTHPSDKGTFDTNAAINSEGPQQKKIEFEVRQIWLRGWYFFWNIIVSSQISIFVVNVLKNIQFLPISEEGICRISNSIVLCWGHVPRTFWIDRCVRDKISLF